MNKFTSDNNKLDQLIQVDLIGRFMLSNRKEFACQIKEISLDKVVFSSLIKVQIGNRIISYIDQLGRIEGQVSDVFEDGFIIDINATTSKRENLAAKLIWFINREELGLEDQRRQKRMIPTGLDIEMILDDGRAYKCQLIDLSIDGAAFDIEIRPEIGTHVTLGKMSANVVRHLETGIAVEFIKVSSETMATEHKQLQQEKSLFEQNAAALP